MENYLKIAIPTNKEQLRHLMTGIMTGIHCLFPPSANPERDSISIKKLKKGEGVWALQKDLLSFEFNGLPGTHMIWLEDAKSDNLLVTVKSWLRGSRRAGLGVPFDEFKLTISKVRHAFLAIPEEQGLRSPINRVIVALCHTWYFSTITASSRMRWQSTKRCCTNQSCRRLGAKSWFRANYILWG